MVMCVVYSNFSAKTLDYLYLKVTLQQKGYIYRKLALLVDQVHAVFSQ